MDANKCFMRTKFRGVRLRDENFRGQNRKKWTNLSRYISVNNRGVLREGHWAMPPLLWVAHGPLV